MEPIQPNMPSSTLDQSNALEPIGDIERLRDILYGDRVRSLEGRLDEVDQRITRLFNELNRRIDHEVEELIQRVDAAAKRLDDRILSLRAQSAAELRQAVDNLSRRLEQQSTQHEQNLQQTRAAAHRELEELRNEIQSWRQKTGQVLAALVAQWKDEARQE